VVEISPLGLVEMTRQNVTDGPREILTRRCTVCGGDGVVLSEASAAVDTERRLRALAASAPRTKAFVVELNARVASILVGPGASRLAAIEEETRRRFLIETREDVPTSHFEVVDKGTLERLAPKAPVAEGAELELKLVEVGLYDVDAGVGKLDGYTICVGGASRLVGRKARVRVERVLDGTAYATLAGAAADAAEVPITAEREAEKPTRRPPAKKRRKAEPDVEPEPEAEPEEPQPEEPVSEAVGEPKPKKKTRRGSRGGRRRRKKPAAETAASNGDAPKIHLPDPDLGRAEPQAEETQEPEPTSASADGEAPSKPKKKTPRGSRGGRRRRKSGASAATSAE
jgi:ribonuclease G